MNVNGLLERISAFVKGLDPKDRNFSKLDVGILKTMMMLSAVDGDVSKEEMETFRTAARSCRGCTEKSFDALWDGALRASGYMLMLAKTLSRDQLVKAFVLEAEIPFVREVMYETSADREAAFESLRSLAQADGEYSDVEKACVEALVDRVREAWKDEIDALSNSGVFPGGAVL